MFQVIEQDTNFCEIPVGFVDMDFEDWIREYDLEIVDDTTVRAEWGNGEGYDTFTVVR